MRKSIPLDEWTALEQKEQMSANPKITIFLKKERNNVKSNNLSKKVDERFTQIFQDCSSLLVLIARAQVIALL